MSKRNKTLFICIAILAAVYVAYLLVPENDLDLGVTVHGHQEVTLAKVYQSPYSIPDTVTFIFDLKYEIPFKQVSKIVDRPSKYRDDMIGTVLKPQNITLTFRGYEVRDGM